MSNTGTLLVLFARCPFPGFAANKCDPGQCALADAQPGFAFPGGPSFADVRRPAPGQTMPAPKLTKVIALIMLLIGVALILAGLLMN
jgi:hypothetical protein